MTVGDTLSSVADHDARWLIEHEINIFFIRYNLSADGNDVRFRIDLTTAVAADGPVYRDLTALT